MNARRTSGFTGFRNGDEEEQNNVVELLSAPFQG